MNRTKEVIGVVGVTISLVGRVSASWVVPLLILLTLPAATLQAQFTCTTNGGTITITGYTGPGGAVVIPSEINGLPVSGIGASAFEGNDSLVSITIPDSVTAFGDSVFAYCHNLTSITIPGSVTNLGASTFQECDSLASATIPSGVTSIGDGVFSSCTSMTSVTIPSGVTSIGNTSFYMCLSLTSVTIPGSVTIIGGGAFESCGSLTSVTIPNGVTTIAGGAFAGCPSLTEVTIGSGVTTIGASAFAGCASLTAVYFQGNAPTAVGGAFSGDPGTVYYLAGTAGWGASFCGLPTAMLNSPPGPAITAQPQSLTLGPGSSAVFSVAAIGTAPLAYQWFFGDSIIPGATGTNYTIADVQSSDAGYYEVVVTNGVGATTSDWAALHVVATPMITTQPPSQTVAPGALVGFIVAATGSAPLSYQWQFNGLNLTDGGQFSGTTSNVLWISSVLAANAGAYDAVVSNYLGAVTSAVANLAVTPPAEAQFTYTNNNGAITITRYTGPGGAVTIPNTIGGLPVTSIGTNAFTYIPSLTSVTIPNGVTNLGREAFSFCANLTNVAIPSSVTSIGEEAFAYCNSLNSVYLQGNAPSADSTVFGGDQGTVYYLPGTSGWGPWFGGLPTTPSVPPSIVTPPWTQTAEIGSFAAFWVEVTNIPPAATYQWYFNGTNVFGVTTNSFLELTNVQPAQVGAYAVVVTSPNAYGAVTSAPALLSVIPPVERTVVPAVGLPAGSGTLLHLEYSDSLATAPAWSSFTNLTLGGRPQLCFDLSQPPPAQRFFRAWQTNGPQPTLSMSLATEIPLTGAIGSSVQIDYINQFGPTNAWVTLDTVTLTNSPQLYFDVTMFLQPTRLYRLVPVP